MFTMDLSDLPQDRNRPRLQIDNIEAKSMSDIDPKLRRQIKHSLKLAPCSRKNLLAHMLRCDSKDVPMCTSVVTKLRN